MSEWTLIDHRDPDAARKKACVVFIHGFGGDAASTWGKFPRYLANNAKMSGWDVLSFGYESDLAPDFLTGVWKGDPDIKMIADSLQTFWRVNLRGQYDATCVIAHSMGGLAVQRAILDHTDFRNELTDLFLFGTPSGGLKKASLYRRFLSFLLPKRSVKDMAAGGNFIKKLRARWTSDIEYAMPFRFWTTAGEEDRFVPPESSLYPFEEKYWGVVPGDHVSMVKPETDSGAAVELVVASINSNASTLKGPWNEALKLDSANVASQRSHARQFVKAHGKNASELDKKALATLALAYDQLGEQDKAMQVLANVGEDNTDAMGILAGRLKRAWWETRKARHAERAMELYDRAYKASEAKGDHEQAFYHGINSAFLKLAFSGDRDAAETMAGRVLDHCSNVNTAKEADENRMWRYASEGEALMILGESEKAMAKYKDALAGKPKPWQVTSMCVQAFCVADTLGSDQLSHSLFNLFKEYT